MVFSTVISKREPPGERQPKKEHGDLFRDVKFDPTAEPKQRVRFDRANANIIIATKAPSVAAYLDKHGSGSETPQGQVLLAELVTEAVCFEIARRGVENGVFLAPLELKRTRFAGSTSICKTNTRTKSTSVLLMQIIAELTVSRLHEKGVHPGMSNC